MSKRGVDWPRCPHPKRDGTPCGSATRTENGAPAADGFCSPHAPKALVETRTPPAQDVDHAVEPESMPGSSVAVESLRDALRDAVSTEEIAGLMQRVLLQALEASKESFTTCPSCHKRHPVTLPDLGVRAQAVRSLIESLEGRMKEQTDADERKLDRQAELLKKQTRELTDDELARLIVQLEAELAEDAT
jgi:hypothetical protein